MIVLTIRGALGAGAFLLQVYYGIDPLWAAAIVAVAVSAYVTLGGLSAVVWTDALQHLMLAAFALAMAYGAADAARMPTDGAPLLGFAELFAGTPEGWWNPLSMGLPTALIFSLAVLPGGITEQDPWQRVWASRGLSCRG